MTTPSDGGRIITFYSYKGGTGRSMALANVAWILASHGLRVLAVDWDLEAPGLHRYFHPFLEDKELENSPGLIDYVVEFSEAARHAVRDTDKPTLEKWYDKYTSLLRYTYSLDWDFGKGTLDFVPAGQQGSGYSLRVNGFDWQEFYEKLGGGVLLEALKKRLREDYDYVLIDSRTGISDTSGVCTVQMPDDLVLCFTLNHQSISGAAAVAKSADLQRRRVTAEPSLRIWPVPTRVELAEKERLEAARGSAREAFQHYLGHLKRDPRRGYWSGVEILYQPYFAYEEVLAVFAEKRGQKASMLSSLEYLAGQLTDRAVETLADMPERERLRGYALFQRAAAKSDSHPGRGQIFISFPYDDIATIEPVAKRLQDRFGDAVWWDRSGGWRGGGAALSPGDDWREVLERALREAKVVLAFFGPNWAARTAPRYFEKQLAQAFGQKMRVIPVLVGDLRVSEWAKAAETLGVESVTQLLALRMSGDSEADIEQLSKSIEKVLAEVANAPTAITKSEEDPEDPQKGQWGGKSSVGGRMLAAEVRTINDNWFEVTLSVSRTSGPPLEGVVEFHLHRTFPRSVEKVEVRDGRARLRLSAWGAFTVGAVADDGRTMLELDLSENTSFPEVFRSR